MVIAIMRTQTVPLIRMKAENSAKRYRLSIKFIIRMLKGFQISNLNS